MKYLLPIFSLSVLVLGLTACESTETTKPKLTNPQQEIIFGKPVLQEDVTFNDTIKLQKKAIRPASAKDLISYKWQLISATTANSEPLMPLSELISYDEQPTLKFSISKNKSDDDKSMTGTKIGISPYALMNRLSMTGFIDNGKLQTVGVTVGTAIGGPRLVYEGQLVSTIDSSSFSIDDSQKINNKQKTILTQTTADGSVLMWQGTLTNEGKYGEPEIVYLEVDPQTEQCSRNVNQPGVADKHCLKVRDINYNRETSEVLGHGEWRLMTQIIEGYTHSSRYRLVLLVKAYTTDPVDIKGKQLLYIHGGAVERDLVKDK